MRVKLLGEGAWFVILLELFSLSLYNGIGFAVCVKWLGEVAGFCWWDALLSTLVSKHDSYRPLFQSKTYFRLRMSQMTTPRGTDPS
jgi:hypothetical protein